MGRACPYCGGGLTVGERRCERCARLAPPGGWHGTPLPGIPASFTRCPSCDGMLTRTEERSGSWHGMGRAPLRVKVCQDCGGRFVERMRRLNLKAPQFHAALVLAQQAETFPEGCTLGELKARLATMFTEESIRGTFLHRHLLQAISEKLIVPAGLRDGEMVYKATR